MRDVSSTFDTQLAQLATAIDGPIGVAVSGGSDSLSVLLMTRAWAVRHQRDVLAFTVDHGLRPAAAREAARVSELCQTLGIPHETLCWRPDAGQVSQAKSRNARHALLATAARGQGCALIVMGHTYDDQLETVYMRRARFEAVQDDLAEQAGLAAMRPLAVSPVWPCGRDVYIGRPALALRRSELRDFLRDQNISWVEDPSNQDLKYERVRVRRSLECLSPEEQDALEQQFSVASQTRSAHDILIADWIADYVHPRRDGLIELEISNLPDAELLSEVLAWLLMAAAGSDRIARLQGRRALAADISVAPRRFRGRTLGGAQIAPRQGRVHIARDPGEAPVLPEDLKPGDIWDGRFLLRANGKTQSAPELAQNLHEIPAGNDGDPQVSALARPTYPFRKCNDIYAECLVPERLLGVEKVLRY